MKKRPPYNDGACYMFWLLAFIVFILLFCQSCATGPQMKRDCQKVKHYKHKNGFYI